MRELLILRHAKSSWAESGVDDHDRPLNPRGFGDAPRMGQLLRELELVPDLILASTALRAATTAKLVAEACGFEGEPTRTEALYLADPQTIVDLVAELTDRVHRVLVVAHNPGLADLVFGLTGGDEGFPTAALAAVRIPIDHWSELALGIRCELKGLWRPKEL